MRKSVNPYQGEPLTGEPDAGKPPVRFGGRGNRPTGSPYPYHLQHDYSLVLGDGGQFAATADQQIAPSDNLSYMGDDWRAIFIVTADSSGEATITWPTVAREPQRRRRLLLLPLTATTTSAYNADSELLSTSSPSPSGTGVATTSYSYDFLGDQVSQALPDPTTGVPGSTPTTFGYDLDGETVSLTDPVVNKTSWTYDSFGDQVSQWENVALAYTSTGTATTTALWTWQYDLDGNVVQSIDADANYSGTGNVINYSYNTLGEETGQNWYTTVAAANSQTGCVGSKRYSYRSGWRHADGHRHSAVPPGGGPLSTVAEHSYWYDPPETGHRERQIGTRDQRRPAIDLRQGRRPPDPLRQYRHHRQQRRHPRYERHPRLPELLSTQYLRRRDANRAGRPDRRAERWPTSDAPRRSRSATTTMAK